MSLLGFDHVYRAVREMAQAYWYRHELKPIAGLRIAENPPDPKEQYFYREPFLVLFRFDRGRSVIEPYPISKCCRVIMRRSLRSHILTCSNCGKRLFLWRRFEKKLQSAENILNSPAPEAIRYQHVCMAAQYTGAESERKPHD